MLVEDEENISLIYSKGLMNNGFSVLTAKDGQEGLDTTFKEKPDLILLDILMPKIDGLTMAKNLKKANVNIPIIFLTNVENLDYIDKALELGISDYIIKADLGINSIVERIKQKLNLKKESKKIK